MSNERVDSDFINDNCCNVMGCKQDFMSRVNELEDVIKRIKFARKNCDLDGLLEVIDSYEI